MPNFWERPEMSGMLRDVRTKPDKYAWLGKALPTLPAPEPSRHAEILDILKDLAAS